MSFDSLFGPSGVANISCPVCKAEEFDARQNQWETWRECRKCGNKWSGGSASAGQPDFALPENLTQVPPAGVPAADEDLPVNASMGVGYRNPDKVFEDD